MKTILVDAARTFVTEEKEINRDLHALLETYPNPKLILTNANPEQQVEFGLVDLPYEMFTLNQNPKKIDPIYYETMLKQYDLTPDDVVYFEHNADAVGSAQSLGITTHHYDHEQKDLNALKTFFDENL